ncbi:DUF1365 domain-containing protein, partial [Rhodospirillum rubrum]|uniref:DUF1365 domain-containing protein n=2 Tax=Rhodospirillum rubrum TaxID=1085 RepID=UPI00190545A7
MRGGTLYHGTVLHNRLRPRRHRMSYKVFSLLVDIDALPELGRKLRLFAHNGFALFGVHDRDHGAADGGALRPYIEGELARAGIDLGGGRIDLLCYPRVLGYVFNPLSVYYCRDGEGVLRAIVYEVRNTFGERHSYLIPVTGETGVVRQDCPKEFYVSPFMEMACTYHFRLVPPEAEIVAGSSLAVSIEEDDAEGPLFFASFAGEAEALSDGALARAFLRYRLMTLKVMGAIHWEALKLVIKGMRLLPRPPPPAEPVTILPS